MVYSMVEMDKWLTPIAPTYGTIFLIPDDIRTAAGPQVLIKIRMFMINGAHLQSLFVCVTPGRYNGSHNKYEWRKYGEQFKTTAC